jgi:hypothetical protein
MQTRVDRINYQNEINPSFFQGRDPLAADLIIFNFPILSRLDKYEADRFFLLKGKEYIYNPFLKNDR